MSVLEDALQVDVRLHRGGFDLDACFVAPRPGVTALFGPSGCGKSTLVGLIAGLLAPSAGRIVLGGRVLLDRARGVDVPAESRHVAVVFQEARLFPHLDVRGNLNYGARRAPRAAPGPGLEEVLQILGIGPLLDRRPSDLSGGEKQRVALGRALLARPALLLLDEPLASLDAPRRAEVLPYLERIRDRFAVPMIYVSHQFDEVLRLASHVVLMESGRVVAAGDVAAVSRSEAFGRIVGPEALGTVLRGRVTVFDAATRTACIVTAGGELRVELDGVAAGEAVQIHVLARDVILARSRPEGLSVRNALEARIEAVRPERPGSTVLVDLVVGAGDERLQARVTDAARRDLELEPGLELWALVKSASLRGQAFAAR